MDSTDENAAQNLVYKYDDKAFDSVPVKDMEKFNEYKNMESYRGFVKPEIEDVGNSVSFDELKRSMVNVTRDGKIKKKVIHEGRSLVPDNSKVFIHYSCYLDHCPTPFDTSKNSKKPVPCVLDSETIYPGFEISLKSMKCGEKSQFLVHPDYAFGKVGVASTIPPDSTLLLEIDLVKYTSNVIDSTPDHLKDKFDYNFKIAKNFHQNGNLLFAEERYKDAIVNYKKAAKLMTECKLDNDLEEKMMKEFLIKIYSNLMVVHNKINLPKKVCTYAWEAFYTDPDVAHRHAKIYFNLGKAKMALHDFRFARIFLNKAKKYSNSLEITKALEELDRKINMSKLVDCEFLDQASNQKAEIDPEFLKAQKEIDNLINNNGKLILPKKTEMRLLEYYIKLCQENNLYMYDNFEGDWIIEMTKSEPDEESDDEENEESVAEDEVQQVFNGITSDANAVTPVTDAINQIKTADIAACGNDNADVTSVTDTINQLKTADTSDANAVSNSQLETEEYLAIDIEEDMLKMAHAMIGTIDDDDPLILPKDHNPEELEAIKKLALESNLEVIEEEEEYVIMKRLQ